MYISPLPPFTSGPLPVYMLHVVTMYFHWSHLLAWVQACVNYIPSYICIHQQVIFVSSMVALFRNFVFQLRRISNDAGMPLIKDPYFYRYVSGLENVEPLFRQLKQERPELQLIMVILPGKTPVYGEA